MKKERKHCTAVITSGLPAIRHRTRWTLQGTPVPPKDIAKGDPIDEIPWNALGWCQRTGRIQSAERAVPTHTALSEGTDLLSASLVRTRGLR
jgi:hypothetical protein